MDKLLILEMAFAAVADNDDWVRMTTDARVEELTRAYHKIMALVDGCEDPDAEKAVVN